MGRDALTCATDELFRVNAAIPIAIRALSADAECQNRALRKRPLTLIGLTLVSADAIVRHRFRYDTRLDKCYVHASPCADLNQQMNWRTKPAPAECGNPNLRTGSHLNMKRFRLQWRKCCLVPGYDVSGKYHELGEIEWLLDILAVNCHSMFLKQLTAVMPGETMSLVTLVVPDDITAPAVGMQRRWTI